MKTQFSKTFLVLTVSIFTCLFSSSKLHAQYLVGSQPFLLWNYSPGATFVNVSLAGRTGSYNFNAQICSGCALQINNFQYSQVGGTGIDNIELVFKVTAVQGPANTSSNPPTLFIYNGTLAGCTVAPCFSLGSQVINTFQVISPTSAVVQWN